MNKLWTICSKRSTILLNEIYLVQYKLFIYVFPYNTELLTLVTTSNINSLKIR